MMPLFLGYDLGSSSAKACLLDGETGRAVARASYPEDEMKISSPRPGWAEQHPDVWWECVREVTRLVLDGRPDAGAAVGGIGISYQMHGLVLVDEAGRPLRPAIIWCDSRAVDVGDRAFRAMGEERCLSRLLNSPGNFTAAKLAWVKHNEPEIYARAHRALLPGDELALRLTGRAATTVSGLSEGIFWDFEAEDVSAELLDVFGLSRELLPEIVPTFGEQGRLTASAARELGLSEGTPVTYRAGDQPNNALSLNVLEPGEIAATAGTSGVVYGVSESVMPDPRSRVNLFAHVNHQRGRPRLGVLLCINGAGSSVRWLRHVTGGSGYAELDAAAARAPVGSDGLCFLPFGNGAERMLEHRALSGRLSGLDFNRHDLRHLARAVQEGVAFSFRYGLDVMRELDIAPSVLRAGDANLFRSAVFREAVTGACGVTLTLYDTDGAEGAARGAAIGRGHYGSFSEAFASLAPRDVVDPTRESRERHEEAYRTWRGELLKSLS